MSGHTPWAEVKAAKQHLALSGPRSTRPHLTTGELGSHVQAACGKKPGDEGWLATPDDARPCRRCVRVARRWGD